MTEDNMKKRNMNKPECCILCSESETINHLFFDCIVAREIWQIISKFFAIPLGTDYLSIARFWLSNKKNAVLNSVCSATLWCIWKFRNDMIFNGQPWLNLHQIIRMILLSIRRWRIIFKDLMLYKVDQFCAFLEQVLKTRFELTMV
jgi:hypothetical protein